MASRFLRLAADEVPVGILWWIEPSRMPAFTDLQLTQLFDDAAAKHALFVAPRSALFVAPRS